MTLKRRLETTPDVSVLSFPSDLSAVEVRTELEQLLSSRLFSTAGGQSRFLRFVVEETIQGRASLLKEYSIGVEALCRGESFDPRQDSIVRVEARKLRSKLIEYYDAEGRHDQVRIELLKGSYVPTFTRSAVEPGGSQRTRASVPEPYRGSRERPLLFLAASYPILANLNFCLVVGDHANGERGWPESSAD